MKFFPPIATTAAPLPHSSPPSDDRNAAVINECGVQNAGDGAQVRGPDDSQASFVRFQLSLTSICGLPLCGVTHAIQMGQLCQVHRKKQFKIVVKCGKYINYGHLQECKDCILMQLYTLRNLCDFLM